jgi:hypothetical protein
MIDYITPAQRLAGATSLEAKRAAANVYLDAHQLSVLRHGFTPTKVCDTDVSRTMALARQREAA